MFANLVLIGMFLSSVAAIFVSLLALQLWRKRAERHSPLRDRQVGHVPGQQLVTRLGDSDDQLLTSLIVMYFAFPIMLLAWALGRVPPDRFQVDGSSWMYVIAASAIFCWACLASLATQNEVNKPRMASLPSA